MSFLNAGSAPTHPLSQPAASPAVTNFGFGSQHTSPFNGFTNPRPATPKLVTDPIVCEAQLTARAKGMKFILKMMEDEAKYPDRGYIMEIFRAIKGGKLDSELAGASSIEELQKLLMINVQMNQQPYE